LRAKRLVGGALIACVAVSLVLFALRPVPGGRHYEYALIMSLALAAIWLLSVAAPRTFFGRGALAFVLLAGLVLGIVNLGVIRSDSEIVKTYRSVFDALEAGKNPYTSGTIYHEIEGQGPVLGNFNYPPLEIYPYYLAYKIAGTWNMTVLAAAMIVLQALAVAILFLMFPRIRPVLLLPFVPMILLGEVKTTVALTLLVTAAVLWVVKRDMETPRPGHRTLVAVLFGFGLMTKFLVAPLMLAYYWHGFDPKRPRGLVRTGIDLGISVATAALIMAPFGLVDVFKNTVLFNIVLKDRAALTTFYPNVLSGPLAWAGWSSIFPVAAVVIMAAAIVAAPKLRLFPALLAAGYVFMFVATTPEPQFLPALLFIVVVAQGLAAEAADRGSPGAFGNILRPGKEIAAWAGD
jgi:hypothetical protein